MKEQESENSFEHKLRQKAGGFRMKPSEEVWEVIKSSLGQRKRKRRFLWLWAAAAGLLLGTGLTTLYFMLNATPDALPVAVDDWNKDIGSRPDKSYTPNPLQSDHGSHKTAAAKADSPDQNSNEISGNSNLSADNHLQSTNQESTPRFDASPNTQAINAGMPGSGSNVQAISMDPVASREYLNTAEQATAKINQFTATTIADPYENDDLLKMEDVTSIHPDMIVKSSRFSLGAQLIPLISDIRYGNLNTETVANADEAFVDSITKLKASSGSPLVGFSAGVDVLYDLSEKFSLGGGVYFTRTGEKNAILQAGNAASFATDTATIGTSSNPSASLSFIPQSESLTHYNWLEINLQGEWYFINHERNKFSLSGGGGLSHFISYTYTEEGNNKRSLQNNSIFSNDQQPPVFHAYQLTAFSGMQYRRMISNHLSLVAGVQFHYYLSSITLSDIPVVAHPYWLGINTGITYRF